MKRNNWEVAGIVLVIITVLIALFLFFYNKEIANKNFTERTATNTIDQRYMFVQIVVRAVIHLEDGSFINKSTIYHVRPDEKLEMEIKKRFLTDGAIFDRSSFPNKKLTVRNMVISYDVNFYSIVGIGQVRRGSQLLIGAKKFCMPVTEFVPNFSGDSSAYSEMSGLIIPVRGKDAPELVNYLIERLRREGNTFSLLGVEGPTIEFEEAE